MEKMPYNLNEMLRNVEGRTGSGNCCDDSVVPGCINTNFCLSTPENMNGGILTMAFVDIQPLDSIYPPETSFKNGTLFPNLDKPFHGGMYK